MTGQLKDRKKARQDGPRAGQVQDRPAEGQEECQTGWKEYSMQDIPDAII